MGTDYVYHMLLAISVIWKQTVVFQVKYNLCTFTIHSYCICKPSITSQMNLFLFFNCCFLTGAIRLLCTILWASKSKVTIAGYSISLGSPVKGSLSPSIKQHPLLGISCRSRSRFRAGPHPRYFHKPCHKINLS